jgi:hypothetical protein
MRTLKVNESFERMERLFINNNPFVYTRFGDGELMLMDGWKGKAENHYNSPELMKELKEAFLINNDKYLIASLPKMEIEDKMSIGLFAPNPVDSKAIEDIVNKYGNRDEYLNYITFHYYSVFYPDKLKNIIDYYFNSKKNMFVGGEHLNREILKKVFNIELFVRTPKTQAYKKVDEIYDKIKRGIINNKFESVFFAAGICTKVLQKRLWNDGIRNVYSIDIGSLADFIAGEKIRTWIKKAENNFIKLYEKK